MSERERKGKKIQKLRLEEEGRIRKSDICWEYQRENRMRFYVTVIKNIAGFKKDKSSEIKGAHQILSRIYKNKPIPRHKVEKHKNIRSKEIFKLPGGRQ